MADSLRGHLVPLVLCCVSGGLAGIPAQSAKAENLPPLQVDPSLLGPAITPAQARAPVPPVVLLQAPRQIAPPQAAQPALVMPVAPAAAPDQRPVRPPAPPAVMPTAVAATLAPDGGMSAAERQAVMLPPPRRQDEEGPTADNRRFAGSAAGPAPGVPARPSALPLPTLASSQQMTPADAGEDQSAFVSGDRIYTENGSEMIIQGHAEVRQMNKVITADRISYAEDRDQVDASGNVRIASGLNVVTGPHMRRKLNEATGSFEKPVYELHPRTLPGRKDNTTTGYGHADSLEFEGPDQYRLKNGTYTTCQASDPDWYAESNDLFLDYSREVGRGKHSRVVFKNVPILYAPILDFSLNNARKSGFLTPTLGTSSTSGVDFTLPYYWNIAPNMDATLTPRLLGRRGVQFGAEFRYLQPSFSGTMQADYLNDKVYGKGRYAYAFRHAQDLGYGFSANLNVNGVSDDKYFADLGTSITTTAQTTLVRQGSVSYGGSWWSATVGAQRYQTLQDPNNLVIVPYDRLPYALFTASKPFFYGGTSFEMTGSYDDFVVSDPANVTRPEGKRIALYPQLSLPLSFSGIDITPKVGYHINRYSMTRVQTAGDPTSLSFNVPVVSVDSGLTLERDAEWEGRKMVQTLEPRLYYLYVPYRDQSRVPVFDTAVADFNFTQIFAENIYAGKDRIADANQLTAAVSSRMIDATTGSEAWRAAIGQRFYFRDQSVTLPGETARTDSKTDILASFSGRVLSHTYLDTGWQFAPQTKQTQKLNIGARYQPAPLSVLNVGYRYKRDTLPTANDGIRDIDVSAQWPLGGRWHAVGRYDYSLHDKHLVESLAGVEYNGGCWVGRLVMQRYATTSTTSTSTLFFQLELNGFSKLGSEPGDVLRRSIPGYGRVNEQRDTPLFGMQ